VIRRLIVRMGAVVTLAALACAATFGLSAAPALADTTPSPVVLVSTDGVTYTPNLSVGLFENAGALVPGDTVDSELYIKNPIATSATIRVNVSDITSVSPDLLEYMQLTAVNTLSGATITATWAQLMNCAVLVMPVTIPGSSVLPVKLTLEMLNAPAQVAQSRIGWLHADVQMEDAVAGSFPAPACDPNTTITDPGSTGPGASGPGTSGPGTSGPAATKPAITRPATVHPAILHPAVILGFTGETFPTQLLMLGGVLVGVGWFLVAARRRRKREQVNS
jgi:LPXTG-motif cell wall-anchored protein